MDQYWMYEHWKTSTCADQKKVIKISWWCWDYNAVRLRSGTILTVMCLLQVLSLICSSLTFKTLFLLAFVVSILIVSSIGNLSQGLLYIK
jgi:hypothetical protein